MTGKPEAALDALRRAAAHPEAGRCDLEPYLQLVEPFSDPPAPQEWGAGAPQLRQLLGAARTSDHFRRLGKAQEVLAAIDRPVVWRAEELQTAARLVSAYLYVSSEDDAWLFFKAMALARFAAMNAGHEKMPSFGHNLPIPGATFDKIVLPGLAYSAAEWLRARM
jgi:hypothetical protein